jgi:hypothetical protein
MEDDNTIMAVDPPIGAQLTQPLSSVHSLRFLSARSRVRKNPTTWMSRVILRLSNRKAEERCRPGLLMKIVKRLCDDRQGQWKNNGGPGRARRSENNTSDRSDIRGVWRRAYACGT